MARQLGPALSLSHGRARKGGRLAAAHSACAADACVGAKNSHLLHPGNQTLEHAAACGLPDSTLEVGEREPHSAPRPT